MKRAHFATVTLILAALVACPHAAADYDNEGWRLLEKGWRHYKSAQSKKDQQESIDTYLEGLQRFRALGDKQGIGVANLRIGIAYHHWGEYAQAEKYFRIYHDIAREAGDQGNEANALNWLGELYRILNRYNEALECDEKALSIGRKIKNLTAEANALNNLGTLYRRWRRFDEAVKHLKESLEVNKKRRQGLWTAVRVLNNLGLVYLDWGRFSKAVHYFEKSIALTHGRQYQHTESLAFNNLGLAYLGWGNYEKAIECFRKTMAKARTLNNPRIEALALNNLGVIYQNWGRYDKALELYQRSLELEKKLGKPQGEARAILNVGTILRDQGNYQKALERFQDGLAIYQMVKIPDIWPKDLIGNLYLDMGKPEKARPYILTAGYWASLGRYYLLTEDFPKAREYYEKLRKSAESNRSASNLFTSYTGLGMVFEALGKDEEAARFFQQAVDFTEELRTSLTRLQRERFFDVKVRGFYRIAPYEGLARVLMRLNRPLEAWKGSEYSKARLFAEAMSRSHSGGPANVPAELLQRDAELNDQLACLKKLRREAEKSGDEDVLHYLTPQVKEVQEELTGHIGRVRRDHPLFAASKYPEPMSLSGIALKPQEWALAYDVTDTALLVFLLKGKRIVSAALKQVSRKQVDDLIRRFRKPLEEITSENLNAKLMSFDLAAGKRLADLLLGDVLEKLPKGEPVIVITDDSLGVLPFEMLVLNDNAKIATDSEFPCITDAVFLADRNPLSYYQSLTALTITRNLGKPQKAGKKRFVMNDPIFDLEDARLTQFPEATKTKMMAPVRKRLMEIQNRVGLTWPRLEETKRLGELLRRLAPDLTDVFSGMEASEPLLLQSPLDRYQSMVFATHGYFGSDLPGIQEPVLVLTLLNQPAGVDGFLTMSEVLNLKLNADIVALTACQSGLGKRISGEGTMGMGRAFQYAGAKSVLMSLWSVAERTSVTLVARFFEYLQKGTGKLDALSRARQDVREQGYDHPFFWAPFILVGEVN